MPRSLERFLLLFFLSTTTILGVLVWKNDLTLRQMRDESVEHASAPPEDASPALVLTAAKVAPNAEAEKDRQPPTDSTDFRARMNQGARAWNRLNDNPEAVRLMALQQRAELDSKYADLFRLLGLSPEKRAALQNLLTEKMNLRREVAMAARGQGINARQNPDAFEALLLDAQSNWEKDVQALLTPEQYGQLQAYEATTTQRALLDQLNTRLSYTGTSLTASQQASLMALLPASTASSMDAGGPPAFPGGRAATAEITDAVVQQATSILSSDQVAALKELQAEQAASAQLRELMRSTGARPGPPGAP